MVELEKDSPLGERLGKGEVQEYGEKDFFGCGVGRADAHRPDGGSQGGWPARRVELLGVP